MLTIDQSIQYETERALVDQVNAVDAKGGMAIVMDVRTGDILAMANVDGETADSPAKPASSTEQNRTVTDVFEPGSTNKVVTIAAALEAGLVKPDTVIPTPSALLIDGTTFEDVEPHPSEMTVADILRESSNVGTITIARDLGKVRFDAALRNFGFGRVTGLDFPGEAPGSSSPLANYNDTSMASMPIGNGLAVTALQMLDVYVTLANNGVRPPAAAPRRHHRRRRHPPRPPARHDAPGRVSPRPPRRCATCSTGVVQGGTGVNAAVPGYTVAGQDRHRPQAAVRQIRRTATSRRSSGSRRRRTPGSRRSWCIDEPARQFFGGTVAAPVFSRIMQQALAVERVTGTTNPAGTVPGSPVMEGPAQVLLLDLLDGITPLDLAGDPAVDVRCARRTTAGACTARAASRACPAPAPTATRTRRQAVADGAGRARWSSGRSASA